MPIVNIREIIGGEEKEPEPIITSPRSNGVDIYNSNGEKVGNVPYGENGIVGAGEKVYQGKDDAGKTIYSTDPYKLKSYISFDENTGKITMHAPQEFFDSEVYSTYFKDDVITGLSRLYSQNKDAKVEMADGTQKTVKELIDDWNKDLPKIVRMQQDYSRMGRKVAERLGDEAAKKYNLGTYRIMNTSAYSGKNEDYIALPKTIINNPNWSFFKEIKGFDGENLVISKGDFVEGYYHLDASRDIASDSKTSISKLKKDVANALANYDGDDVDEFARLIAFNNFLNDQTQEGASNAVDGAFYDKLVIGGAAIGESFARNTAKWATNFVNSVSSVFLSPFSLVDLIATGKWNSKRIIDETVNTVGDIIGEDLTPDADSVAEFLQNEEARRGEIYSLTNSTMGLLYNLAGAATYISENIIGTIATNRLIINGATLAISGISVGKSVPNVVENLNKLNLKDAYGNTIRATRETVIDTANSMMTESGVPQAVADLLTGSSKLTTWQKLNLIGSLNPSDVLAGAAQWNSFIGKVGLILRNGALYNMKNFEQWYMDSKNLQSTAGSWRTVLEIETQYNKYRETLGSVYVAGRELWLTSAKMVTTLERFAKYVPTAYYVANVIIGTAIAEADTFRMIMDGVDSDEERSQLWSMVGRTALGWTIGMVVGSIVNKVFNGTFDAAAEYANAGATEKVAKGVNIVSGRINQVRELLAGKDLVDNIKNPVKKAAVKYNQSLQKSQEYLAKAADAVRASGGTEAEARAATIGAIEQMRENQNKIDFAQNPNYLVDAWSSEANPAYFAATMDATGLEAQSSKMLSDLGLANDVKTTALIGGVSANGTDPQEVVNYKVRALQRMGAFRDDYDYSSALIDFNSNLIGTDITGMYVLKSPSFIREREIAKKYMADFEARYPKAYTDFIKDKWAPAMLQMSYQFRQIEIENGYYLGSREEGWKATGMFGGNNELWFPVQRITDAQKDFEEAARTPLEIIRKGAVKRRNYEPEHYSPGSDEMTDFVHPMITWKMYEYQRAVAIAFNDLATANFMNPYVKQVTRLDGAKVGAAKAYEDLEPTYSKSVIRAMGAFKDDLEKTGFANDLLDKQKMETKIRNAKKAVDKARETWEGIPDIEVTVTNADRSRTIDTLPEDIVDDYLDRLEVPFEGERVDVRKWLNNQVPGFDVLEWSLLGRDHTNGLVPGGLYETTIGRPLYVTRAYIINIDDLAKILGYDLDNAIPTMGKYISMHINNNTGKGVLPVRLRKTGDGDGNDFFMQMRWGHNGDKKENWVDYLQQLKENGVENVPIAVVDTRTGSGSEGIPSSIAKRIGYTPTDITDDIKTAFSEFGKIPFYRGQKGLGQFNMNEQSPSRAVGDAYWIAPNASYTDTYGKDKIAGYIPIKYFLSDKEKAAFIQKGKYELGIARKELWPKIVEEEQKLGKQILKELEKSNTSGKELVDQQFSAGLITESEKPAVAASSLISSGTSSQKNKALKYRVLYRIKNAIDLTDEDKKVLAKMKNGEEILRYIRLDALLGGVPLYKEYDPDDIQDYRVLAELTGKPVIDISNDGFADGTAFFYYKGISPEFDEDVGGQLAIQEAGTLRWPDGLADEMAQEWFDETTLGGFLNMLEERFPDVSDKIERVLDGLKDGKAAGDSVRDESDLVLEIAEDIKNEAPGLYQTTHVLGNRIWTHAVDGYDLDTSLTDMGMSPDRYYNEHDVSKLLEEVGYENPDIVTQEESSAWDAINPSSPNYPTYTDQDLADIRLRDLGRKRKILKKELRKRCD